MEKLTYEQWVEKYNPLKNHFTDAPYEGFAFETFGEELEFVKKFQNCFIWTAISCFFFWYFHIPVNDFFAEIIN